MLFVWFGTLGEAPTHEPVQPGGFLETGLQGGRLLGGAESGRTRIGPIEVDPRLAIEDRVDTNHFIGPHQTNPPILDGHWVDGPYFSTRMLLAGDRHSNSEVLSTVTGIGVSALQVSTSTFKEYVVLSVTPVDEELSMVYYTVWVEPQTGREDDTVLERVLTMMRQELSEDIEIWRYMRHSPLPSDPAAAQPSLTAMREWATQFLVAAPAS